MDQDTKVLFHPACVLRTKVVGGKVVLYHAQVCQSAHHHPTTNKANQSLKLQNQIQRRRRWY